LARILITGGSGFLGRNLASSLNANHEVILTSRNQKALMSAASELGIEFAPLDVANFPATQEIVGRYRPNIIVHAAATKFVDLAEKFPQDCVDNNVVGSQNIARAAAQCMVDHVIGISTDKAAPPIANIYGQTKAIMERLFVAVNSTSTTKFSVVRYGNVAWSTGSVFPIWQASIHKNGHVVSTGADMSRFFFKVDDAVKLIKTSIDHPEVTSGKILSYPMKGVVIRRILEVWSKHAGFSWSTAERRIGDRNLEYLIGSSETSATERVSLDGEEFFLMNGQGKPVESPLTQEYSSITAPQMSDEEILNLVSNPPERL
jgi:UDP-N-acetylglucosamine 4,6-dehydratase